MATLNTISLSAFTELADNIFLQGIESIPEVMRNSWLVKEMAIPQNTWNSRQFTEVDLEEYASNKWEWSQSSIARVQQWYTKTMTKKRIAADIDITYEMRMEGKNREVVDRLTSLWKLWPNRLDLDLTHRITFWESTTYTDKDWETVTITVWDWLALFSTAHTLTWSSSTFRNILANNPQLSKGSLEWMEKLVVEETLNNLGEKMAMSYDTLFTTDDPNIINTAREILQSTADISSSNAWITNVYKWKYKHVILPRLATTAAWAIDSAKNKRWGIASSTQSQFMLWIWESPRLKSPAAWNNWEDFSTDNWTYWIRSWYGITIPWARWVKVSYGTWVA